MIRFIGSQRHQRCAVLLLCLSELLTELLVSHGLMSQCQLSYSIQLLIGIINILHLIHEPRVSVGIRVLHGNGLTTLQRHDDIAHVQHVHHREDAVTVHLGHITSSLSNRRHHLLHLGHQVRIDQLLIAAQLGSMIATNTLMVVRSLVLVEGVRSEVQHTVVTLIAGILQDELIRIGLGLRSLALTLVYEHIVVQVALVHCPHINKTEHQDNPHGIFLLQFSESDS